jgi:AraC family transcriptional regulator
MKDPELKQRELVNMRIYDKEMQLNDFRPDTIYTKCASFIAEVNDYPIHDMTEFIIPSGKYALFRYMGLPADVDLFFHKIFTELLPAANLTVADDNRPHFDILDKNYHITYPGSKESIYIPIK